MADTRVRAALVQQMRWQLPNLFLRARIVYRSNHRAKWPSANGRALAAERLAFFQIGCEAGEIRFRDFFFLIAALFLLRFGISSARFTLFTKNRSTGQTISATASRVRSRAIVRS
ncbi:MAG: hypothetical protein DMF12_02320 [Verrucomicrobia bacterium]|nr:MAG: hypothetical protein DMF12_02320 [Verrucomicrobiota bacterium]